jgi:hypothetical protein
MRKRLAAAQLAARAEESARVVRVAVGEALCAIPKTTRPARSRHQKRAARPQ